MKLNVEVSLQGGVVLLLLDFQGNSDLNAYLSTVLIHYGYYLFVSFVRWLAE